MMFPRYEIPFKIVEMKDVHATSTSKRKKKPFRCFSFPRGELSLRLYEFFSLVPSSFLDDITILRCFTDVALGLLKGFWARVK